jgi:hypothetical protein
MSLCGKKGGKKREKKISGMREKVRKKLKKNQKKGFKKCKRINLTIKRGWQDSQVWGVGGRVLGWTDPEGRCTRTPDSGSGHTPARGKAKGEGGLDPKSQ